MSRENIFQASKTNISETGLTAWYGLIGASLSVGAPLIGTMNAPLAIISAVIPLFARWNQIYDISKTNETVRNERWNLYAQAAVKAIVNIAILAATYSIGLALGPTACFLFLVSFCVSKFINLGDASPIQHIEDVFSSDNKKYPKNRQNLFRSLSANATDTLKASFYGLVATATQFPLPLIGKLTEATATIFFIAPLSARMSQISQIAPEIDQKRVTHHQAKALVSTVMDILVGLGLFATATILQLDKIAILAVLAGWAAAKLTSGGESSPINHIQGFFSKCSGAEDDKEVISSNTAQHSA